MTQTPLERQPASGKPPTPNSLFREILNWMLAPLLVLWLISIVVTHHIVTSIANEPYDQTFAAQIISGVLLSQFVIIPLAVALAWFGLSRGLKPLARLRERMARRRPGDLSPISIAGTPRELQPMVHSFNELMDRLEENLQAQQRFIADAAHQMKTPMTGLRMQAELAAQETDPMQLRRSVEQIAQAAKRASHLITQLLTLARAEASHEKLHRFEIVDLESLAREVTLGWRSMAWTRQIDLSFEGSQWPCVIDGVPLLLHELLKNLIDNAIKYTPRGGQVTVRVTAEEHIVLAVEDNGIGVAEEDRERIFERFYRVLGTNADGSGLGLSICKEIAELHRAAISLVDGAQGRGSRVVAVFPRDGSSRSSSSL